jgi:hypothetical protein
MKKLEVGKLYRVKKGKNLKCFAAKLPAPRKHIFLNQGEKFLIIQIDQNLFNNVAVTLLRISQCSLIKCEICAFDIENSIE